MFLLVFFDVLDILWYLIGSLLSFSIDVEKTIFRVTFLRWMKDILEMNEAMQWRDPLKYLVRVAKWFHVLIFNFIYLARGITEYFLSFLLSFLQHLTKASLQGCHNRSIDIPKPMGAFLDRYFRLLRHGWRRLEQSRAATSRIWRPNPPTLETRSARRKQ